MAGHLPRRRKPAHPPPVGRFNESMVLFVTVCAVHRVPILNRPDVFDAMPGLWSRASHWRVGRFLLMPDHIHLFCTPGVAEPLPVKRWVEYWKHMLSIAVPRMRGRLQRDCWDTQMRNRRHYDERLRYMADNPVRAGLVIRAEDWPYQGKVTDIRW